MMILNPPPTNTDCDDDRAIIMEGIVLDETAMIRQLSLMSVDGVVVQEDDDDDFDYGDLNDDYDDNDRILSKAPSGRHVIARQKHRASRNLQSLGQFKNNEKLKEEDDDGSAMSAATRISLQIAHQTHTATRNLAQTEALALEASHQSQAATRNLFASIPEDDITKDEDLAIPPPNNNNKDMNLDELVSPRRLQRRLKMHQQHNTSSGGAAASKGSLDSVSEDGTLGCDDSSLPALSDMSSKDLFSLDGTMSSSSISVSSSSLSTYSSSQQAARIAAIQFNFPIHEHAKGKRLSGLAPKIEIPQHKQLPDGKWGTASAAGSEEDSPATMAAARDSLTLPVRELSDRESLVHSEVAVAAPLAASDAAPCLPRRELSDRSDLVACDALPAVPRRQTSDHSVVLTK
jgi:hypothetical protein